mgnify:CR=1 FL=1
MRRFLALFLVVVWAGLIAVPAVAESGGHGKSGHGNEKSEKKAAKTSEKASSHGSAKSESSHGPAKSEKPGDDKAAGAASREARGDRLSATEFVTMNAFTVPMMTDGKVSEQFTIVVALELTDEDMRHEVVRLTPFLRNEIYNFLFKSVTFRTGEPRIPRTADLRAQLFRVVRKIAKPEQVKAVVVQQAVRAAMP